MDSEGHSFLSSAITIEQYAARWLDGLSSRLRSKTVKSYRGLYLIHIQPKLGSFQLAELKRAEVKTLLLEKKSHGLSRNTVRLIGACLSAMCSEAMDDGLVSANPAASFGRWIGRRCETANQDGPATTTRPLTEQELALFLETAQKSYPRYYPLFLTLARTGCRPGEALALRWPDVDFDRRQINIERGISAGKVGPTKTGRRRCVDMSRELASVLGGLKLERTSEACSDGSEWIFTGKKGSRINEDWPRRVFRKALDRARLPNHTLYDLRHTFASLHLSKGHPITYVSTQLGHSDPSTTLRWYAHWLPQADNHFADSLDGPPPAGR